MNKNIGRALQRKPAPRRKRLAALLLAALSAAPLLTDGAPPDPVSPPSAPPTSVLPPRPPSKEFSGIPWGSFLVFPELVLSGTRDDNIYARRRNEVKDTIYTLSPSLGLRSNWRRHGLNAEIGIDADRYSEHTSENVDDYWAGVDGHYDFGPLTNVFAGARFSRDHEDRSESGELDSTVQAEPTRFDRSEAHLGIATGTGPWRLRAGGTYDQFDYKDGLSTTGAVTIDHDFRDRSLRSVGARLGYLISPAYEVFGQYATDTRDYDNNIPGQTFNRGSDGYRAALGLRVDLPRPDLKAEVFAGTLKQKFDYAGFADVSEPYYGALLSWRPTERTTFTGFIDRSLEETTVFQDGVYASSSIDTTSGFQVEHKLTSDLSFKASGAYTRSVFQGFDRLDKIVDAGAGLRYYFARSLFVGADVRLIDRDSNVLDAQYSRNQVVLSVGYTPARSKSYSIAPAAQGGATSGGATGSHAGFYAGLQVGHGALGTETFGPREDNGLDSGEMGGFGESGALFAGWGAQFGNWYLGAEIDANGSNANSYHSKAKDESRTMSVEEDAGYGLSARAGYLLEGGMLYGALGVVRTEFRSHLARNQFAAGAFDAEHTENGVRLAVGTEIPASQRVFVRLQYSYTDYGEYDVPYQSDVAATTTEKFDLRKNLFSVGLGWRFGATGPKPAARDPREARGFYAGAGLGHGTLGTLVTGLHRDQSTGPFDFTGDFASSSGGVGAFAGYGHTFGRAYAGAELEAESANSGWYHSREAGSGGGGRDFAVEKRGGYGAALRLGYVLANGTVLYGRAGPVRTRFNTIYNKGPQTAQWIDRSDKVDGARVGVGAEVPASRSAFVRLDYTYTKYDAYGFVTAHAGGANADEMNFEQRENLFRLGIGFRF